MSELTLKWILGFFFFECAVVLIFIVSCYGFKLYYLLRNRSLQRSYHPLFLLIEKNQPIPRRLSKNIPVILNIIKELDEKNPAGWADTKTHIVRDVLLPQTRRYIDSRSWEKRYWLVLCLSYYMDPEDNELLMKLIQDKSTLVSLNAMGLASGLGKKALLKEILFKLASETHPFHTVAIQTLEHSQDWLEAIQESFATSEDPWVKKIGYELLRKMGTESELFETANQDCFNTNMNVRLAAIRALPYLNKKLYLETFKQLIQDKEWMVRNAVVKTLREIQDQTALDILEIALNDSHWRVRVNTAKTLSYLGKPGEQILAKYKADPSCPDEAEYFLQIQQLRKNQAHD